jgi:cysteine synthase A
MHSPIKNSFTHSVLLPDVIQLNPSLYAATFFLMKLLPAKFILDKAREAGSLTPRSVVVETTSGTFGLALALLCNEYKYKLILVTDPAVDKWLKQRIEDLGAHVDIVTQPAEEGGFQRARLERVEFHKQAAQDHFWPSQYDNPHNPGGYAPFAEQIAENLGDIDCLIGTVGSGGSVCGTSHYLRHLFPHLRVIGVDTQNSVLFGCNDGKRLLRGLGNSLMPYNVDHTCFDEIHWVSAAEAFYTTRRLHKTFGLFMGPTSGAAFLVAEWWAKRYPDKKALVLMPDQGYRYQETVYNDEWLKLSRVYLDAPSLEPKLLSCASEMYSQWSYVNWNRRSYVEMTGVPYSTYDSLPGRRNYV